MSAIRYSGNYTAVIDHRERTVTIRSRISEWSLLQADDQDDEDMEMAIDFMDLDELIKIGYKLERL